jgi:hypothetical protein
MLTHCYVALAFNYTIFLQDKSGHQMCLWYPEEAFLRHENRTAGGEDGVYI